MNKTLEQLLKEKDYWEKKKAKRLRKIYHNVVLPWIILGIGSLVWLIMGWGMIAGWVWIAVGISAIVWGIYWMWKFYACSQKLALINKKIRLVRKND